MAEPLKFMFNQQFVGDVAATIAAVHSTFDREQFLASVFDADWDGRELKARTLHISQMLRAALPEDYADALGILRRAAPQLPEHYRYEPIIFPQFVEDFGLDAWEISLSALEQFTAQSSAEFAVRPFIIQDEQRMMAQIGEWARHDNFHVRRLASEGCRPRLPWAMALPRFKKDPAPILPILEQLKFDDTDYVRRSVANNLNDITKDNPDVVLTLLEAWGVHDHDGIRWMTSHALRSLVKQGDMHALRLLGYGETPKLDLMNFSLVSDNITIGESLEFSFELIAQSDSSQALMIDYVIHYMRGKGKTTPKVFKLSKKTLPPHQSITISKKHSFKPVTTRRYYPGQHAIEIQINGQSFGKWDFVLNE